MNSFDHDICTQPPSSGLALPIEDPLQNVGCKTPLSLSAAELEGLPSTLLTHRITGYSRKIYIHSTCPDLSALQSKTALHGGTVVLDPSEAHILLLNPNSQGSEYTKAYNKLNSQQVRNEYQVLVSYGWLEASIIAGEMLEFPPWKALPPRRRAAKMNRQHSGEDGSTVLGTARPDVEEDHVSIPLPEASTSALPLPLALPSIPTTTRTPTASSDSKKPKHRSLTRAPFNALDDHRLIRYFAKYSHISEDQPRSITSIAKKLAESFPNHSSESWRERYKRAQGGPSHWNPMIEEYKKKREREGYVSPGEEENANPAVWKHNTVEGGGGEDGYDPSTTAMAVQNDMVDQLEMAISAATSEVDGQNKRKRKSEDILSLGLNGIGSCHDTTGEQFLHLIAASMSDNPQTSDPSDSSFLTHHMSAMDPNTIAALIKTFNNPPPSPTAFDPSVDYAALVSRTPSIDIDPSLERLSDVLHSSKRPRMDQLVENELI